MKVFEDFYVYPWLSYQENNCNTVFIDGHTPVLIDPGHTHLFDNVVQSMARDGVRPESAKMVLCTHGHPDHIEAIERFDESVIKGISKEEYAFLNDGYRELFLAGGSQSPAKSFNLFLKEGTLQVGDKTFRIFLTPGHAPGAVCLYWEEKKVLISGDTVFYMGVGRTDLYGGDASQLAQSIARLAALDIEYLIPGHGEMVQGEKTIKKNFEVVLEQLF
ncbi:MAG TPA: MBL fold metallo-hydrolase [Syntrophorhabdaceae bacterium]|jgi:glyoxylase-like metal-dependent hydrolase (beta-lactamase superfamily II)